MKRLILIILCSIPFFTSADNSSQPLIVVDGEPMLNYTIDSIDQDNIEQMTILKTDIATKTYGEQGKNGVLAVTTKKYTKDLLLELDKIKDKEEDGLQHTLYELVDSSLKALFILFYLLGVLFIQAIIPMIIIAVIFMSRDKYYKRHLVEPVIVPLTLRFSEHLIDTLVSIILTMGFLVCVLCIVAIVSGCELTNEITLELMALCEVPPFFLYYFICEFLWGKTLGKKICGTKVVTLDGSKPSAKTVAIRTFCRIIPFNFISFFFTDKDENGNMTRMWHDILSHTRVTRITTSTPQDT